MASPAAGGTGAPALCIAIVGLGMGMRRADEVRRIPGARLAAVCDTDPARLREAEARFGCAVFDDYGALMRAPGIDCVFVTTPTHLHLPVVRAAAEAGRHVIVTKPMEVSVGRAAEIALLCEKAGVILVVDYELRYDPVMRQVKAAMEQGLLGRILSIEARLQWYRGPEYYRSARGTLARDGGGVLAIQAVHLLDQMIWLAGFPTEIDASLATLEKDIEVENYAVVQFRFADPGMRGLAVASLLHGDDVQFGLIVAGTAGSVDTTRGLHGRHQRGVEWCFRDGKEKVLPQPAAFPGSAVEDLLWTLRFGGKPQCGADIGLQSMRLLEAAYRSSRTGRPEPTG